MALPPLRYLIAGAIFISLTIWTLCRQLVLDSNDSDIDNFQSSSTTFGEGESKSTINIHVHVPGNVEVPSKAQGPSSISITKLPNQPIPDAHTSKSAGGMVELKHVEPAYDLTMTSEACEANYPNLFDEIKLAVARGLISGSPKKYEEKGGMMKIRIYDNKLYIVSKGTNVWHRQSAILHQIQRALQSSPEKLPNIVATFSVNDHPAPNTWSLARSEAKKQVQNTWLMPDFGGWSWPEPGIGTMEDIREKIAVVEREYPKWDDKISKAVWRGTIGWNKSLRGELVKVAGGAEKDWADVQSLKWGVNNLGMEDFCRYKFLIYTEGVTYSGRLRYFQHCRSIIFTPKLTWHQYYHPAISYSGPTQNVVEVAPDWSDLEEKVRYYRDINPKEGERIANNNVETFVRGYLSDAAEVCYWRRLIRGWAEVTPTEGEVPLKERGVSFESYVLMGKLSWENKA